MSEVWVATNLTDDGEMYGLLRAGDLRHLRLVGKPRPRLMAHLPGSPDSDGWVPIVDSGPEPSATRFSGVMDGAAPRPVVPAQFHLELVSALEAARIRAAGEGQPLVVRATYEGSDWRWRTDTYGAALAQIGAPAAAAAAEKTAAAS
ncbi:hypothetical protein [Streptomyces europaeiscabiei]|uniref:hypothetical protein n=1 Tax=Streptomyces europaeiscabiei TaxID=146819 RepID=UPI0029A30F72|nr:hypothetical protein [Streptomyces europaeiscabiei]MDX3867240.1 hypothetical protein [Streptomyces europaeiscabiei]